MVQRIKQNNRILIIAIIMSMIIGALLIITQTGLFYTFSGDDTKKTISFAIPANNPYVVKLFRNDETPAVLDWASFANGQQTTYDTSDNEKEKVIVYVSVPQVTEKGNYYVDYKVNSLSPIGPKLLKEGTIKIMVI